ncbi:MAG: flagellin [Arcobacteraceae bacterium]|nr:flagellin [Arcobacteraceae bacterium]
MTINNTNTLNNINYLQSGLLEKISTGLAINKASDDASGMAIADNLRLQNNSISQAIENVNSGVAMSNIAQDAISSQKDILGNIKTLTLEAMTGTTSAEGRESIANQINKYIEQYDQIADSTNYNGEQLLKTSGDPSDDISIVGDESIISMQKTDTTSVTDQLKTFMADFATNPDSMKNVLSAVDDGMNTLSSAASEFGSASNALESMARGYMTTQTNIADAQSSIMDFDFAKGISDFNKTNILSQVGYLAQSQANAVQSRTVALLS